MRYFLWTAGEVERRKAWSWVKNSRKSFPKSFETIPTINCIRKTTAGSLPFFRNGVVSQSFLVSVVFSGSHEDSCGCWFPWIAIPVEFCAKKYWGWETGSRSYLWRPYPVRPGIGSNHSPESTSCGDACGAWQYRFVWCIPSDWTEPMPQDLISSDSAASRIILTAESMLNLSVFKSRS